NSIIVMHIMHTFALPFPFEHTAQFDDMETKRKMPVIPEYLRNQYPVILTDHMERLRKELSGTRIDYCLMDTSKPLDAGPFTYLAARSKSICFMSFLNPFLLFGSLALALPILIHLVRS